MSDLGVTGLALRIGGEPLGGSAGWHEVDDPSTGELLASMELGSVADTTAAVGAAAEAAPAWRETPPVERAAFCRAVAASILEQEARLIEVDVRDAGLPPAVAARDVAAAARYFEYYAAVAETIGGRTTTSDDGGIAFTLNEPWGVCGIILPFNVPLQMAARDLAPALAMGNAAVLKPAEQAPFAALAIAEICAAVKGAPAGIVNAVVGAGVEVGQALIADRRVAHVTFTGSHRAGIAVMEAAARRLLPTTIELGGKSPHLVFDGADLDRAVAAIVAAVMPVAGQACSAGTRVLVARERLAEIRAGLAAALADLEVGPARSEPQVGPLISAAQRDAARGVIERGIDGGAELVCGGPAAPAGAPAGGHYLRPTLLETVDPENVAAQEEIFGPVITLIPFGDEEEAIAIANGTPYGLVAGVWAPDAELLLRVARRLDAGQVFVNGYAVGGGVGLAFGGVKQSGVGRAKGIEGALEYANTKTIVMPAGRR